MDADPTTVAMTPTATRTRPTISVPVGILFSTKMAHTAHTTGMEARMIWL